MWCQPVRPEGVRQGPRLAVPGDIDEPSPGVRAYDKMVRDAEAAIPRALAIWENVRMRALA
jgi:hypothetical protein